jgi:lysozyme
VTIPGAPKRTFPQAPGAPKWNEKPAAGAFPAVLLVAGLAAALLPSEDRRLKPYLDSARIPTACMGIIGPEVNARYKAGTVFTRDECIALEQKYLLVMVRRMGKCIPADIVSRLTYGEWISYGHWAYNTGTESFCSSSIGRRLAQGDHAGACRAMGQWTWITRPASAGVPRGIHKPVFAGATARGPGLLIAYRMQCNDPLNRCSGLATRREIEVSTCLAALN